MRLAVIPARGGSKRVPRKNVRPFAGRPMIAWPIAAAIESGLFDRIVVSTEDEEIVQAAVAAGAEAPFRRPPTLSDDHTPTRPVIQHAIREMERLFERPDLVCCIYATAPFLHAADLQDGFEALLSGDWDYAFAATSFAYPVQRALRRTEQGGVAMLQPEFRAARSQDLEEACHDAGMFYWGRAEAFLDDRPVFSDRSTPIMLPRTRVHDIDTEEDWARAELVFRALYGAASAP
jgi:N-acylneuraminate cytidylyltransferase